MCGYKITAIIPVAIVIPPSKINVQPINIFFFISEKIPNPRKNNPKINS